MNETPNIDESNKNLAVVAEEPTLDPETPTVDPMTPISTAVPKKKPRNKKKLFVVAGVIVALAIVLVGVISFMPNKTVSKTTAKSTTNKAIKTPSSSPATATPAASVTPPATTAPGIPNYLYQSSQTSQGSAVGYLKVKQSSYQPHGLFGSAVAAADSPSYQTAIFYTKSDGVYVYTGSQNGDTRVSSGSSPVFSSILQKLAVSNNCAISVHDFASSTDTTVATPGVPGTQPGDECYRPTAWSPDGKYLLFISTKPVSNADIGLIGFSLPYLYNVTTKQVTAVPIPDGYNSLSAAAGHWQDTQTVLFGYVNFGKQATILASETASYNLSSNQTTKLVAPAGLDVASIQVAGKVLYARANGVAGLYSGTGLADNSLALVNGISSNVGTFLLEVSDDNTVSDIITAQGQAGSLGGVKFYDLTTSASTQKQFYTPSAYSSNLIGWGQSYDQLIYNKYISATSTNQIRQYTISSGQDDLLVDNVSLSK